MTCRVAGCDKPQKTQRRRGTFVVQSRYCSMHLKRVQRHGDPFTVCCRRCGKPCDESPCDDCLMALSRTCVVCGEVFRIRHDSPNNKRCDDCIRSGRLR